eukprot:TRINITY_DN86292_c0_g1_i1.p1 TRINITY_DN86292_c0_g1~~TRINITY_DN86292_c0_g1_i1.p1  ORF type:complete len:114 (+),score=0.20 TRINITY_DN86292_c0_g1_i1:48-389(+)
MSNHHTVARINPDTFMSDVAKDTIQQIVRANSNKIIYSEKYYDDVHEYRHVTLPKEIAKLIPKGYLMADREWRSLGVQQSLGWEHYMWHKPESHILLYRRAKGYQQPQATNRM